MSEYPEIAARFARDTSAHQLRILKDDGLYRHLRFQPPPTMSSCYWFDLITVPGALIFQGDGNTFAFRRVTDMFEFFRHGIWRDGSIHINPVYWSEKLTSDRDSVMTYSQKLFEEEVAKDLAAVEEDYPGITKAWASHLEDEFNVEYEEEARRALDEFRFGEQHRASCSKCDWQFEDEFYTTAAVKLRRHRLEAGEEHTGTVRDLSFTFSDTWEWQLKDFDWWFLWACNAIVWGIARYDRVNRYGLRNLATVQRDGVRFEEPARRALRGREARQVFAGALRARPGDWALLGKYATSGSARQSAYCVRQADDPQDQPFAPAGSFEAEARTMLGEHRVYARYVGGSAS